MRQMAEDRGAFKTIQANTALIRQFVIVPTSLHGSLTLPKKYITTGANGFGGSIWRAGEIAWGILNSSLIRDARQKPAPSRTRHSL